MEVLYSIYEFKVIRCIEKNTKMKNTEHLRKRISQFYQKNSANRNKAKLQHFLAEAVARSTIYDTIQRVRSSIGAIRRVGSGRIAVKMPKEKSSTTRTSI
jgi:hypothetical protein